MPKAITTAVASFTAIAGAFTATTTTIYAMSDSYSLIGELRGQEHVILDNMTAGQCIATLNDIRPRWGADVSLSCATRP